MTTEPESVQLVNAFFNGFSSVLLIVLNAWQVIKLDELQKSQKFLGKIRGEQIQELSDKIHPPSTDKEPP